MSKKIIIMAVKHRGASKTRDFLIDKSRNFNNILQSYLSLTDSDTVTGNVTFTGAVNFNKEDGFGQAEEASAAAATATTLSNTSASFSYSGSAGVAESVLAIKFNDLPTTVDQAALIGTGSLFLSGALQSSENSHGNKFLNVYCTA